MWAAQGQKRPLKVFMNLNLRETGCVASPSLRQASCTTVKDLLWTDHESWKSGLRELRGRVPASAELFCLVVSVVVASVRQSGGGRATEAASQGSAPLLGLRCSCLPLVGTLLPRLPLQHLLSHLLFSFVALIIHRCAAEWSGNSLWSSPVLNPSRGLSCQLGLHNFLPFG